MRSLTLYRTGVTYGIVIVMQAKGHDEGLVLKQCSDLLLLVVALADVLRHTLHWYSAAAFPCSPHLPISGRSHLCRGFSSVLQSVVVQVHKRSSLSPSNSDAVFAGLPHQAVSC